MSVPRVELPPGPAVVRIVNTLAAVLGHGCALPPQQAETLPTLRAWCAAGAATAVAYNDSLPAEERWRSCPEGWGGDWENTETGRWWSTGWETATGRLRVAADDLSPSGMWLPSIRLHFRAGPATPGGEPRDVAVLAWRYGDGWGVTYADPELIEGREDRLAILSDLDRALGGEISHALHQEPRWGAVAPYRPAVVAALDRLAQATVTP